MLAVDVALRVARHGGEGKEDRGQEAGEEGGVNEGCVRCGGVWGFRGPERVKRGCGE